MSALVRDIALQHPGQFDVYVDTHCREVWVNNPHCKIITGRESPCREETRVKISYREGIKAAGQGVKVHMLHWYYHNLEQQTGIKVKPLYAYGDLHLTNVELEPLLPGRYWLLLAGGKTDITCKWWSPYQWQEVVDGLAKQGIRCVQAGADFAGHKHLKLEHCQSVVGQYANARQFMNLIYHADGVICPVTAAMHIAAVFAKPCVVLSGGREEPWWEAYTNAYKAFGPEAAAIQTEHRFLHTLGLLPCCQSKGCWQQRTFKLHDGRKTRGGLLFDNMLCKLPVLTADYATPKCMHMITSNHVLEAAMSYYDRHEIPPITAEPMPFSRRKPEDRPGVTAAPTTAMATLQPEIQKSVFRSTSSIPEPHLIHHPLVGGEYTVCVLCYGDYLPLAQRCIESIRSTLPEQNLDLRVGLNAVCDMTRQYVRSLPGRVTIYDDPSNPGKYIQMARMFNDPAKPILSKYLVWFDDDAWIIDPTMWSKLSDSIVANHQAGARLYGTPFIHDMQQYAKPGYDPTTWIKHASWHRGRNLRARGTSKEAPNGTVISFCVGWFWAMAVAAMREAQVPDQRLKHNGGDITIGEMIHQAGYVMKAFNPGKSLVTCPSREAGGRRGMSHPLPWVQA